MKNKITANFLTNVVARLIVALMSLVFLPYYIKYLGAESYGFIGLYISIFSFLFFLDLGITTSVNHGLSLFDLKISEERRSARDLVRTYEIIYWAVGFVLALTIFVSSSVLSHHWVQLELISDVRANVIFSQMAFLFLFQWPIVFYTACLVGLEKHWHLNVIRVIQSIFQWGGAVFVLKYIEPTPEAFFYWQIIVSFFILIFMIINVRKPLIEAIGNSFWSFKIKYWQENRTFLKEMSATLLLTIMLIQLDKFFVSKFLPLKEFGYYSFAISISNCFQYVSQSLFAAIFPRVSRLIQNLSNSQELIELYHRSTQVLCTIVFCGLVTLVYYSKQILLLWTNDLVTTESTFVLLRILAIAGAAMALLILPYTLQMANKWSRFTLRKNTISLLLYAPCLYFVINLKGSVGAASLFALLFSLTLVIEPYFMHKSILRGEYVKWIFGDVLLSLFFAIFGFFIFHKIGLLILGDSKIFLMILFCLLGSFGFSFLMMPKTRSILKENILSKIWS